MTGRIALINVHSARNIGDAALTEVAIKKLHEQFPNYQITLVMNDLQSYQGKEIKVNSFYNWVYKYNEHLTARFLYLLLISFVSLVTFRLFRKPVYITESRCLKATLNAIFQAQIVASSPGGYLYSYGRGRALILFAFTLAISVLAGKPLYLLPQSIGPFRNRLERIMVKWPLSRARIIMVREMMSLIQLEELKIPKKKCHFYPDMAFAFQGRSPAEAFNWLNANNINPDFDRPLLGVTVIDWESQYQSFNKQENYERAVASTIRHFIDIHAGRVILFPQSWGPTKNEDDRLPAKRILARIPNASNSVFLVENPISAALLKAIYGTMDIFIGTRMHSNIFAMSQYVPVIPIGYLHKTVGIAQSVGMEDWVIDIEDIDADLLINKLDVLWSMRYQIKHQLEGTIPQLVDQVNMVSLAVADDFEGLRKG